MSSYSPAVAGRISSRSERRPRTSSDLCSLSLSPSLPTPSPSLPRSLLPSLSFLCSLFLSRLARWQASRGLMGAGVYCQGAAHACPVRGRPPVRRRPPPLRYEDRGGPQAPAGGPGSSLRPARRATGRLRAGYGPAAGGVKQRGGVKAAAPRRARLARLAGWRRCWVRRGASLAPPWTTPRCSRRRRHAAVSGAPRAAVPCPTGAVLPPTSCRRL